VASEIIIQTAVGPFNDMVHLFQVLSFGVVVLGNVLARPVITLKWSCNMGPEVPTKVLDITRICWDRDGTAWSSE
jgi:hypothetical protein